MGTSAPVGHPPRRRQCQPLPHLRRHAAAWQPALTATVIAVATPALPATRRGALDAPTHTPPGMAGHPPAISCRLAPRVPASRRLELFDQKCMVLKVVCVRHSFGLRIVVQKKK